MNTKFRFIWALPIAVVVVASIAIVSARVERQRIADAFSRQLSERVSSVAELVKLSAAAAAESLSRMYDQEEERLSDITAVAVTYLNEAKTLDKIGRSTALKLLAVSGNNNIETVYTDFDGSTTGKLIEETLKQEELSLYIEAMAEASKLTCIWRAANSGAVILCDDAEWLYEFRSTSGLATLLKNVRKFGALYAAIQDKNGIIAASSEQPSLGSITGDSWLESVFNGNESSLSFRETNVGGKGVYEGSGIFKLPDGTDAIIRIGIENAELTDFLARSNRRHVMIVVGFLAAFLVSLIVAFAIDRYEARRDKAAAEAAKMNEENRRWRAIGEMAATVAHEVRNPLSTIAMASKRLASEFEIKPEDKGEFEELGGLVKSQTERVNRVITEFLELGRPLALKPSLLDVSEFFNSRLIPPLAMRAQKEGKRFEFLGNCKGDVEADADRLEQALSNLIINALDAVKAGGNVHATADCKGRFLWVTVKDDGVGMDEATLKKARESFFTKKAAGTGLGLPLADRLIRAHGGTLEISSALGAGTTITVKLPLKYAGADA